MTPPGDETLVLEDGRTLGWATYGDPGGTPLVALHGSPDSRVIWRLADAAAAAGGVRIIAPDRPGFGLSAPGVTKGTNLPVRFTFFAARRLPLLLGPMARVMVRTVRRDPQAAARRMMATRPPADRAIIERPEVMAVLIANLPAQFADPGSIALEMRAAARDWGFPLAAVEIPTTIWQGGLDDVHTPAMARHLHAVLPNSELVFEPDFATFDFFDQIDEILEIVTRGVD